MDYITKVTLVSVALILTYKFCRVYLKMDYTTIVTVFTAVIILALTVWVIMI